METWPLSFIQFASKTLPIMEQKEEMEMDELKMVLSTKFMRGIVTKIIAKAIYKKTGYNVNIQLNEVKLETVDGKVCLHADVDAEINNEDFMKIIKSNGLI